jgi:EmrB/QacA subfamily drug resistance transporter
MALVVVCMAQLMIVLDTTIVNVALPSIQHDLHFTQGSLTWVVNAFLVTFGSFLLLAGRLGDLVGRRRVFLAGVTVFTVASALCGLATDQGVLIVARFVQGIGAAMQASVILAIIVTEFPQATDRARAMSGYVFVSVAGGSIGLLAGGILTEALDWHWIFYVNLPIGALTILLGRLLVPADTGRGLGHGVDWLGSMLATAAVAVAVYAIVNVSSDGWGSPHVLVPGAVAIGLLVAFVTLESRLENPIMPLRILRLRSLVVSSLVRGLIITAMYSTFFLGTLYLEHVLHYGALQTGAAFLPWTLTVAVLSLGITARLLRLLGPFRLLVGGMLSVIVGLTILRTAGAHTAFFPTLFLAFGAIGLGIGNAFVPLLSMAMQDVPAADAGLGSGITNLSQQVSGALGVAVLGTVATSHTHSLLAQHDSLSGALVGGYHLAFWLGSASVALAILVALWLLRPDRPARQPALEPATAANTAPQGGVLERVA